MNCRIKKNKKKSKVVFTALNNIHGCLTVDAGGCPSLENDEGLGLNVEMQSATYTCRGDILPADRSGRAVANIRS